MAVKIIYICEDRRRKLRCEDVEMLISKLVDWLIGKLVDSLQKTTNHKPFNQSTLYPTTDKTHPITQALLCIFAA